MFKCCTPTNTGTHITYTDILSHKQHKYNHTYTDILSHKQHKYNHTYTDTLSHKQHKYNHTYTDTLSHKQHEYIQHTRTHSHTNNTSIINIHGHTLTQATQV